MSHNLETAHLMIRNKYFWLVLTFILGVSFVAMLVPWSTLLTAIAALQKQLHALLTAHISQVEHSPWQYGSGLILFSFLYGIFHAVGPGHGKAVIVSYLGTQSHEQASHGIMLSFLAALLQAVVAVVLVTTAAQLLDLSVGTARKYGHNLELASYILIMLLGGGICVRALLRLHKLRLVTHGQSMHPYAEGNKHSHQHFKPENDHACGCQHGYVPETRHDSSQRWLVVLSMGLRPCTGAVIVLMYAYVVNVYIFGVIATFAMGIGTGLAVALLATITVLCRTRLLRWMVRQQDSKGHTLFDFFGAGLMLVGGLLLLLLGTSLFMMTDTVPVSHPLL
ncbi:MAG: hypothetical protein RQ714_09270 [Nitrosomonas sp.]|nr:hypothetical protein [Nitrosomonas sp.]